MAVYAPFAISYDHFSPNASAHPPADTLAYFATVSSTNAKAKPASYLDADARTKPCSIECALASTVTHAINFSYNFPYNYGYIGGEICVKL